MEPFSSGLLYLAASGSLSVAMTAGSMVGLRVVHAPACATTLIVSLGLMPALWDGLIILAAVVLLYVAHVLIRRLVRSRLSASWSS
jgi:CBS-domain-containing membrane protein